MQIRPVSDTTPGSMLVQKPEENANHTIVEISAAYPGGSNAWLRHLMRELRYPEIAQRRNITGQVVVTFTVKENGRLENFQAITGPSELQDEAIRVIRRSGRWEPAMLDGKPVASQKKQAITFRLQ